MVVVDPRLDRRGLPANAGAAPAAGPACWRSPCASRRGRSSSSSAVPDRPVSAIRSSRAARSPSSRSRSSLALALAVIRDRLFQVDLLATSRRRIVAAREEERLRLRRDLHDGLGPTLAALGLKVDAARAEAVAGDPAAAATAPRRDPVGPPRRLAQIRSLSRELRPPTLDSLGLVGALRQQLDALIGRGGHGRRRSTAADLARPPAGDRGRRLPDRRSRPSRTSSATRTPRPPRSASRVDDTGPPGRDRRRRRGRRRRGRSGSGRGRCTSGRPRSAASWRSSRVASGAPASSRLLPLGERPRSPDGQPTATATATGAAAIRPGVVGPGVE